MQGGGNSAGAEIYNGTDSFFRIGTGRDQKIGVNSLILQWHFSLIDAMGIGDDQTVLSLSEDPCETADPHLR